MTPFLIFISYMVYYSLAFLMEINMLEFHFPLQHNVYISIIYTRLFCLGRGVYQ